eukprot:CAMPEP_0117667832 /NCGR_PEP_ID=MMETSP0804-20121206/11195_1 /TAXON_ID=1074897 /ORGANISM="Tetraselmis astigmatica, Strain CCMP880" /LENGTH=482 /DNA_ID=CAMNT_0005475621 /DNA_START=282 /DNA_END=1730 /DNA_ORIENTATION=+
MEKMRMGVTGLPMSATIQNYRASVLVLTFIAYTAYHACRKPPSIVKSVLLGDGSVLAVQGEPQLVEAGWAPFNGPNGTALLGNVDLAFLGAYAIGMFFAGHLGDRMDLRVFLGCGMLGSAVFVSLYGMGYFWDIHNVYYYYFVMLIGGVLQSGGWPSVVSIMANWFGKGKRGLIMGIWNAHTSVGNILGSVMASILLPPLCGWGWAFIGPGIFMGAAGLLVWFFLIPHPADVPGLPNAAYHKVAQKDEESRSPNCRNPSGGSPRGISFLSAWAIPGVTAFALCLFFTKLVAYTFLYWLPFYIKNTAINGHSLTASEAGALSVLFDVGGVFGGIMAGFLSDFLGASAIVASGFVYCTIPVLYMYRTYGHLSMALNVALMMLSGFFVNGPYALITTAVSADLGTHESLAGSEKALATVTAIIDGMGSMGAAIGPFIVGYIARAPGGFNNVFYMLYSCCLVAGLLIGKLVKREWDTLGCKRVDTI